MKKIFYILASAIVALGAVACENDGLDNIGLEVNGDTVSFIASIDNTKTALNGLETIWDEDDVIVVKCGKNEYTFSNKETGDKNKFSCTAVGVTEILTAETITATYSHEGCGTINSAEGTQGALLTYTGSFAELRDGEKGFEVKNAFLKFTAEEGVVITASEGLFDEKTRTTFEVTKENAGEIYVAVNAGVPATLSYKVGENEGKNLSTTFEKGVIYNLGSLTKAVAKDNKGKFYTSLADAFKLAEDGATISLLEELNIESVSEGAYATVSKNLTFDVNYAMTVTTPTVSKNAAVIKVAKGASLTVVGSETITITNGGGKSVGNHFISNEGGIVNLNMDGGITMKVNPTERYVDCIVDNNSTVGAATLNVTKGTYKQDRNNIFRSFVNNKTEKAIINITGGEFIGTDEVIYIWQQKMGKTTCEMTITGGTFENVELDNDNATLDLLTFDVEGYELKQQSSGYYLVVPATVYVAQVGETMYENINDAIANAGGSTVELLANIEGTVEINTEVTINAGTYTINISVTNDDYVYSEENGIHTVKLFVPEASEWGLVGSFQSPTTWDVANPVVFYTTKANDGWVVVEGVELYKSDEFKFVKGNSWTGSLGYQSADTGVLDKEHGLVDENSQNIKAAKNGKFNIYLNPTAKKFKYTCVEEYTGTVNITIDNKANWNPLQITLRNGDTTIVEKATVTGNVYPVSMDYIGESLSYTLSSGNKTSEEGNVSITKDGATINLEETIIKLKVQLNTANAKQWWGNTMKIHAWGTGTSFDTSWPGNTMTSEGNYTWSIVVPSELVGKTINFLVHNGNGWQSSDSKVTIKAEGNTVTGSSIGIN